MSVLSLSCVYADNKTCAGDKMDFARFVFVAAFQSEEATPQTHTAPLSFKQLLLQRQTISN
jgi:hypothetical protein